jgi:RHS repeat-associated protein
MTDYDGPGANNDTTYRYDALGRRITKNVNGTKTAYVHDGLNTVAEYNGNNQLQRTYVTPGLDQNVSLTASGSTYFYLSDALGSIRQLLDADQATQNSYDYQAFGSVFGSPTENVSQPYRFTGREWDVESGLYYYRMRDYSPSLGRLGSRDLAKGDRNLYTYVRNDALFWVDPLGLYGEEVHRDLTEYLARAAGLSPVDAGRCGALDQSIDTDPSTRPADPANPLDVLDWVFNPERRSWHFPKAPGDDQTYPGSGAARRRAEEGIGNCNLSDLCHGLHPLQDSWSHQGGDYKHGRGSWSGLSHDADKTYLYPDDARAMAAATYDALRRFAECCHKGSPKGYDQGAVDNFIKLGDPTPLWSSERVSGSPLPLP